uniref:Uncharacterized protein n=1 Tax=Oryza punctata TaxID=4537 RepID=A0A0E0K1S5_ORYPU
MFEGWLVGVDSRLKKLFRNGLVFDNFPIKSIILQLIKSYTQILDRGTYYIQFWGHFVKV